MPAIPCLVHRSLRGVKRGWSIDWSQAQAQRGPRLPQEGAQAPTFGLGTRGGSETSLGTKDGAVGTCRAMGNAGEASPRLPGARGVRAWHWSAINRLWILSRVLPGQTGTSREPRAAPGAGNLRRERPQLGLRNRLVASIGHRCVNNSDTKIGFHLPEEKGKAKDKRGRLPTGWQPWGNCYPDKKSQIKEGKS